MRRLIFDVGRWSLYLHRCARGLDAVAEDDAADRQLEDELFSRLYEGDGEALPDEQQTKANWAKRVHEEAGKLPDFERLAGECRGDPDAAATAVEQLVEALKPHLTEDAERQELRRALRLSCQSATAAVEAVRDARDGLDCVQFGVPGSGTTGRGEGRVNNGTKTLARRLRQDDRLRRIALLAGRFKRIAATKQRQKVKHGSDEISDIEQGADLARLLPSELGKLVHPRLRLVAQRDLLERACLQYALTGSATLGKGPLVVCIDKSGSMDGPPDVWATAVALALLEVAHRQRRPFALLGFDGDVKYEAMVGAGEPIPEAALFIPCSGGTDILRTLQRGLEVIETHRSALSKADIVLITDGGSETGQAIRVREKARNLGVTIIGMGIGVPPQSLSPWCDEVHAVTDLSDIDNSTAETLFGQ